jgi:hypothetical protein
MALQLKLNELTACNEKASNRLIVVANLTHKEPEVLKKIIIYDYQNWQKRRQSAYLAFFR